MGFSKHTDRTSPVAPTNRKVGRAGVKVTHIVLHHQAGYSATTLAMMATGSRKVSANYVANSDGTLVGVVDENDTPFTNGNLLWNRRSITFEIENSKPNVGKPTIAAHEAVAAAIADIVTRFRIPLDREHIILHRELYTRFRVGYATACPGELDIEYIMKRARHILNPAPASDEAPTETEDEDMKNAGFAYTSSDGKSMSLVINAASGFATEWSGGKTNNEVAAAFGTGSFAPITESQADAFKASAADTRAGRTPAA